MMIHVTRLFATIAWLMVAVTTPALTINFNYIKPGSDPFVPSTARLDDLDGSRLLAHAEQAAADWGSVIQDNWTMDIDLYYADEPIVGTTTASIRTDFQTTLVNGRRRVLTGTIRVFDEIEAWYDPTPGDNSEFSLATQRLLSEATPASAAGVAVDSGDASLLELGYELSANSEIAANQFDLLTIMRHEIGHLMGFNQRIVADHGSDFFIIPPELLGDAKIRVFGGGHLVSQGPLMSQSSAGGVRREISATDVVVATAGSGWEDLHLERVDYLGPASGATNFTIGTNWLGGQSPDPAAAVSVRNGGLLSVISNAVVGSLAIDRGSRMNLTGADLTVIDELTVGRQISGGDTEGEVNVIGNATLSVNSVLIESGQLGLTLGTLRSRFGAVVNDAALVGYGEINTAGGLTNRGTLRATVSTLTITGPTIANPVADLDGGSRFAIVEAITGSLDVQIENDDSFRGRMTIGAGEFIHLPNDWTLGSLGKLQLQGSNSQEAELRGSDLTASNAEITVTGHGTIAGDVAIISTTDVTVANSNARFTIGGNLELNRGTITGNGTVVVQQTLTATNGTINVGELTLGSTSTIEGASVTATNLDGSLRLTAGTLAFKTLDGQLLQQGGLLDLGTSPSQIDGDWTQDGGGTLGVQIANSNDFGQLFVGDDALIDGLIDVELLGGYQPQHGQSFLIIQAAKVTVESIELTGADADLFELQIGQGGIELVTVLPLLGDYNDDGLVDAADYSVWRDNVGASAGTLPNDGDGGSIGTAQYNTWRDNYGATQSGSSTATPEPTALLLSTLALLASASLRRSEVRSRTWIPTA